MDESDQEVTPAEGQQAPAQQIEISPQKVSSAEPKVEGAPTAQPATEQQLQKAEENIETRMSAFERTTIRLTRAGIVIGIITLLIFTGQLYEMWDAGSQTDKIIAADERIAGAMEGALAMANSSLTTTQNSFRDDQRAWVGPIGIGPFELKAGQPPPAFTITIRNSGRTPARRFTSDITARPFAKGQPFEPIYPEQRNPRSVDVIQPNMELTLNAQPGPVIVTDAQVSAIKSGTVLLYIYGKISYQDVFEREHHTTFCLYVDPNLTRATTCGTYNEED